MKIIENNWHINKDVEYNGTTLTVPVWTNWVVVDANGSILACEKEQTIVALWWEDRYEGSIGDVLCIGRAKLEDGDDWKMSQRYVGTMNAWFSIDV